MESLPPHKDEPLCVNGLGGVGKTELLRTAGRVLASVATDLVYCQLLEPIHLRGSALLTVQSNTTISQILSPLLPADARKKKARLSVSETLVKAGKQCHLNGILGVLVDEIQFGTQSVEAIARTMGWLLSFAKLPTPFAYAANFDLCAKLRSRPDYLKDRLVVEPRIIRPPGLGSPSARAYLQECQIVLKDLIEVDLVENERFIFLATANVRRKIRRLLTLSYVHARRRSRYAVERDDIVAAYASAQYAEMRSDTNALFDQALAGKPQPGRKDLWCPFGAEFNTLAGDGAALVKSVQSAGYSVALLMQGADGKGKQRGAHRSASGVSGKPALSVVPTPTTNRTREGGREKSYNASQRKSLDALKLLQATVDHNKAPKK